MRRIIRILAPASGIVLALCGVGLGFAADLIPQSTMSEKIADARLESRILTTFSKDPHLHAFTFAVVVDGNKAVIDGNVDDSAARSLAEQIAMSVEGIERIDNRIIVDADTRAKTAEVEGSKSG